MVAKSNDPDPFALIKINWGAFHLECTIENPPRVLFLIKALAFWLAVAAAVLAYISMHAK